MLDNLLQSGIVQSFLRYLSWAFIAGIFFSGMLVILERRLKKSWLKKVAYFLSLMGPLMLILMISSGSVEFEGTEEPSSLRLSSLHLDALQASPKISQALEAIYVFGCWILVSGSFCSGLLMIIRNRLPKYKIFAISYLFSFVGPILFIFLVWNKSLEVEDWEISGLNASWYQKAAENGNLWAQVELGQCYLEGRGVKKNEQEAFSLFQKAADRGYVRGQSNLAWCHEEGLGVAQDYAKSVLWYQKAAQQGDEESQARLAYFYLIGKGLSKNEKEAVRWLKKAAEKGNAWAQRELARCYLEGRGLNKDSGEAIKVLRKAADGGDAHAQCQLGRLYKQGLGITKNENQAYEWTKKAAERGNSEAQYNLGSCYFSGHGVEADKKKGFEWYLKSANQGIEEAQYNVAVCYLKGEGIEKNEKEAAQWFEKASRKQKEKMWKTLKFEEQTYSRELVDKAEQGDAEAQLCLAVFYSKGGEGITPDLKAAFEWFQKSATRGNANAQYFLSTYYLYGLGVEKNSNEALGWARKSAEQGNAAGQLQLGAMYLNGLGINRNEKEGFKWVEASARQGYPPAKSLMELKEKSATHPQ